MEANKHDPFTNVASSSIPLNKPKEKEEQVLKIKENIFDFIENTDMKNYSVLDTGYNLGKIKPVFQTPKMCLDQFIRHYTETISKIYAESSEVNPNIVNILDNYNSLTKILTSTMEADNISDVNSKQVILYLIGILIAYLEDEIEYE